MTPKASFQRVLEKRGNSDYVSQQVSGMVYGPIAPILRSAHAPITKPLTLNCQEGPSATQMQNPVFLILHAKNARFRRFMDQYRFKWSIAL